MKPFMFAILLATMTVFPVSAAIEVYEFDTPEQEEVFKKLGKELRCPKCQNNNIADSNASLAQDLRMKVYELLKQGAGETEIVDYMVARYGNFVTYNPPLTPSTVILWVGPISVVIAGFSILAWRSRKRKKLRISPELDNEELVRLTRILADKPASKKKDISG